MPNEFKITFYLMANLNDGFVFRYPVRNQLIWIFTAPGHTNWNSRHVCEHRGRKGILTENCEDYRHIKRHFPHLFNKAHKFINAARTSFYPGNIELNYVVNSLDVGRYGRPCR